MLATELWVTVFIFHPWKDSTASYLHCFKWQICYYCCLCSFVLKRSFFSGSFYDFLFFQSKMIIMFHAAVFLMFLVLGVWWTFFGSLGLYFFINVGNFYPLVLQIVFLFPNSLLSFRNSNYSYFRPTTHWAFYFILYFPLDNFSYYVFVYSHFLLQCLNHQ